MQRKDIKGNVWRHLLADAIEQNGGYSSGYHDRFALSWDVPVNCSIPDFDSIVNEAMVSDYGPGADTVIEPGLLAEVRQEWDDEDNQNRMWYWIIDDMVNSVSDADAYKTVRPEIAARYGLAYGPVFPAKYKRREGEAAFYPAGKEGWMLDNPYRDTPNFSVKWEFHGRGGKHLCLTEFEGKRLGESSDSLAAEIRDQEDGYVFYNVWCQKLLAFIHECDLMFTRKVVQQEFHHQVLFRLAQNLQEAADLTKKKAKEAAERLYWEERDCMTV